ncbi:MAG TPA: hypothetical protein VLT36_06820 [Candidatus Dormibacteraeota bacterium]|nr:hypothetical protein [Candidatus Dormibacteraeota bacterium]
MTAGEIIEEIKRLPTEERNKVFEFAKESIVDSRLSPEQLGDLARQMVEATDQAEVERLQQEIVRGFYGAKKHT